MISHLAYSTAVHSLRESAPKTRIGASVKLESRIGGIAGYQAVKESYYAIPSYTGCGDSVEERLDVRRTFLWAPVVVAVLLLLPP